MNAFNRQIVGIASLLLLSILSVHVDAQAAQLTLSWVDSAADETGFAIERSTGTTGTFAEIDEAGPGTTVYMDATVTDGTTYCYRVRAFTATAYSDYSNVACGASAQAASLTVVKMGTGSGTVVSAPSGIICGATCSGTYPSGTPVTLTATAATGSKFTGWSGGGCSGTGSCTVNLASTTTVTASFDTVQSTSLLVSLSGTGTGTVSSNPAGIMCGTTCASSYPYGTTVSLAATAPAGSTFTGWGGACTGTGTCALTLTAATAVSATFAAQSPTLNVSVSGKGTVTSTQAGINCGKVCSATFPSGTTVTLTATAGSGFAFTGWYGGGCSGMNATCTVSMSASQMVSATFRNSGSKR